VADVDIAVGVRRTVMQREARPSRRRLAQAAIEVEALPAGKQFRLLLRQAGTHRE
jgi:hypothetical protein